MRLISVYEVEAEAEAEAEAETGVTDSRALNKQTQAPMFCLP